MYDYDPQKVLDQQTMMGRFYSARSQVNTINKQEIEQPTSTSTLSDPYALGREKEKYLLMNYVKLYGHAPVQKVMAYKGMQPYNEQLHDIKFNQAGSRYTNEDYRLLGETIYKGFHGLMGARWDLLKDVQQNHAAQNPPRFVPQRGMRIPNIDFDADLDLDQPMSYQGRPAYPNNLMPPGRPQQGRARTPPARPIPQQQDPADGNDLFKRPQPGLPGGFAPAGGALPAGPQQPPAPQPPPQQQQPAQPAAPPKGPPVGVPAQGNAGAGGGRGGAGYRKRQEQQQKQQEEKKDDGQ